MISLRLRATLALAAAAFTAACGGGDGSSGPSYPDSVSTADAENFANGIANYADFVSQAMNFGGPSIYLAGPTAIAELNSRLTPVASAFPGVTFRQPDLSGLDWRTAVQRVRGPQAAAGAGCTITSHGYTDTDMTDEVDLNGNNIPDDAYLKAVCVTTDSMAGDTVVTVTETKEIAQKEITASLYGQTLSVLVSLEARDNHGRYQLVRYTITGLQDIRADGITDKAGFKVRQEDNLGGEVHFQQAEQSFNNSFDPTGTIALGSDLPDGALTIAGSQSRANSDGDNLAFAITTTTPLAYSSACAGSTNPPYTAGVLHGKLNNSSSQASFDITFPSCGTFTVDVNGAYDEVMVTAER